MLQNTLNNETYIDYTHLKQVVSNDNRNAILHFNKFEECSVTFIETLKKCK